jgi:hypothetical protein
MSQINPVHTTTLSQPIFLRSVLILPSMPRFSKKVGQAKTEAGGTNPVPLPLPETEIHLNCVEGGGMQFVPHREQAASTAQIARLYVSNEMVSI